MSSSPGDPRVLLVEVPWRLPRMPGLAAATLRPILEAAGVATDVLHGQTLFPRTDTARSVLEAFSGYLFVPAMAPAVDRGALADRLLERYRRNLNVGGLRWPDAEATWERLEADPQALRRGFLADMARADLCVERIVARILDGGYRVLGLSCTFEQQLPAAIAIARRVKAARPELRVALGGATCFEAQGDGLAASFPELDVVCHTEGEPVIVPLVRALLSGGDLAGVPGVAWRDASGAVRRTASPPVPRELDALPIPDYRAFLEQLRASEWADQGAPRLVFETSRGCWWGQKHLCTFCGLNPEGLGYRHKSAARVHDELVELHARHPEVELLQATDNILPMGYLDTVLPRLAARLRAGARTPPIAFMVKSNLRRDQIEGLREAGIRAIQAGVESLHDAILANMDKGATAATQVQLLKWAAEVGVSVSFNLIIRNPGDRPAWYAEMTRLVPYLEHLPPPTGVTPMMLNRFSRYFQDPGRWGIHGVRPRAHYADLWPEPGVDLARVAYEAEFDHPMLHDEELIAAERAFVAALGRWIHGYAPDRVYWSDLDAGVLVTDRRAGATACHALGGRGAELFRLLDKARTRTALPRLAPDLDPELTGAALATWEHRRWIAPVGERWLGVLPRRERRAAEGAPAVERAA